MRIADLNERDQVLARHLLTETFSDRLLGRASDEEMETYVVTGIRALRAWQTAPVETRMPHPRGAVSTAIEYAFPERPLYDEIAEEIGDWIRAVDRQLREQS